MTALSPADQDVLRFMSGDLSPGEWSERLPASPTEILAFLRAEGLPYRADAAVANGLEGRVLRDLRAYGSSRMSQLARWLSAPVEEVMAATRSLVSKGQVATSSDPINPEVWTL